MPKDIRESNPTEMREEQMKQLWVRLLHAGIQVSFPVNLVNRQRPKQKLKEIISKYISEHFVSREVLREYVKSSSRTDDRGIRVVDEWEVIGFITKS